MGDCGFKNRPYCGRTVGSWNSRGGVAESDENVLRALLSCLPVGALALRVERERARFLCVFANGAAREQLGLPVGEAALEARFFTDADRAACLATLEDGVARGLALGSRALPFRVHRLAA